MGKLKQHSSSKKERTRLWTVLVKTSYNAMVVINYVINKHILVESLIGINSQTSWLAVFLIVYPLSNIYPKIYKECKNIYLSL